MRHHAKLEDLQLFRLRTVTFTALAVSGQDHKRYALRTSQRMRLVAFMALMIPGCGHHHSSAGDGGVPSVGKVTPANPQNQTETTVTFTAPADGDKGVFLNTKVLAIFSQSLDPLSLDSTSFTLLQGATPVAGVVSADGAAAAFTPAAALVAGTVYTATLGTEVQDLAGNALASARTWNFTTGTTANSVAPIVSSTNIADGATGVFTNSLITATFSNTMDPTTITGATFFVTVGATPVPGTIMMVGDVATFTPNVRLIVGTKYTVTISIGAKDLEGNALGSAKVWTFTSGTTADTTVPTLISMSPDDGATNVATNRSISATFSKALDATTISASTFAVTQGGTEVQGTLSSIGGVTSFKPSANLLASTLYVVTLRTGLKDLAGNAWVAPKSWSFTTGSSAAAGPEPLALGAAGNFVILSKAGITNVASSAITGDIGTSPITGASIVGLDCVQVVGKIYEVDPSGPACGTTNAIYLTSAIGDMGTAYTDAAGRSPPDKTELGAGEIGGLTIAPGLYKWGSNVTISTEVKLSGGANDVWIFQVAGDLTEANGMQVTLEGGAQAKNIFWQVAGQADLGTAAKFSGTILSMTQIALKTGASLEGRALAQTAVTLESNAIHAP